jgi:hypothetical protein
MSKTILNTEANILKTFSGLSNLRLEPLSINDRYILNRLPEIVKVTYLGDDYFAVNNGGTIVKALGFALSDLVEIDTPENLKCIDINELNKNRY